MHVYELRNWSVVTNQNGYLAPELAKAYLSGEVKNNPNFHDGEKIVTTRIIKAVGRFITTKSGSIYELVGAPSENYLNWLQENNLRYDKHNPVKMIGVDKLN